MRLHEKSSWLTWNFTLYSTSVKLHSYFHWLKLITTFFPLVWGRSDCSHGRGSKRVIPLTDDSLHQLPARLHVSAHLDACTSEWLGNTFILPHHKGDTTVITLPCNERHSGTRVHLQNNRKYAFGPDPYNCAICSWYLALNSSQIILVFSK